MNDSIAIDGEGEETPYVCEPADPNSLCGPQVRCEVRNTKKSYLLYIPGTENVKAGQLGVTSGPARELPPHVQLGVILEIRDCIGEAKFDKLPLQDRLNPLIHGELRYSKPHKITIRSCGDYKGEPWRDFVFVNFEGGACLAKVWGFISVGKYQLAMVECYEKIPGNTHPILVRYKLWRTRENRVWFKVVKVKHLVSTAVVVSDPTDPEYVWLVPPFPKADYTPEPEAVLDGSWRAHSPYSPLLG